jgi:AAA15 family ATPase/GTPase
MRISAIELNNFRCFANVSIELSKGINLIIGANNSGKSTLLKSVAWLQEGAVVSINDLRTSENSGSVKISLSDALQFFSENSIETIPDGLLEISQDISVKADISRKSVEIDYEFCPIGSNPIWAKKDREKSIGFRDIYHRSRVLTEDSVGISNIIPRNFIQPYLSRRKVSSYSEEINSSALNTVTGDFSNLYAKIDYLSNSQTYGHKQYIEACVDILGFPVTATYSEQGKKAVYLIKSLKSISTPTSISIDSMGEGVPNLLGLIVDLCLVDGKLFLIEEPENDIHPKALKKLLKLIAEKSDNNQFIITTHSNIVVKYLGSQSESKLFRVKTGFEEEVPTSTIEEVSNSVEARLEVLEELGYEFVDFDMWSGWLILEEASAEKIIREYLIPWFTPELNGKLKTFSARSLSGVKKKFEAFNNLFVFLHLQPVYKNLAWVVIDAGDNEEKIINELKDLYTPNGWNKENFLQFSEHDFEQYYPAQFKSQLDNILQTTDKQKRQKMKKDLLDEVEIWIKENDGDAKEAFKESASNVIEVLLKIKSILFESKNLK